MRRSKNTNPQTFEHQICRRHRIDFLQCLLMAPAFITLQNIEIWKVFLIWSLLFYVWLR